MSVTVLHPGSSSLLRGLATRLDSPARGEAVSDTVLRTVFPDRAGDRGFVATLRRCSMENVACASGVLAGRLALTDVDASCAREFAALVARLGIPLPELERAYRVGVERLWQEWFDLCRGSEGHGELPDLLGGSTSLLFGYVDQVLQQVVARHTEVTEEMAATSEDRRRELVLALLDGSEPTPETDAALGYRMRGTHVGLLFTGDGQREVTRALSALRERSGAWGSLLVRPDASAWFGWLGYPDRVDSGRLELLRRTAGGLDVEISIGEPGRGLAGFRRGNETARRTAGLRATLYRAPSCLCSRDLRLESLLLTQPESARRFVRDELGELAGSGERSGRIRATLLASLTAGSQAKAAIALGIHENTVRMRIRAAAQELGAALSERRTELLVALRLCEALGPVDAS